MVRDPGLPHPQNLLEFRHRELGLLEGRKNPQAGRIRQGPQKTYPVTHLGKKIHHLIMIYQYYFVARGPDRAMI
jgi:hypothetical protein